MSGEHREQGWDGPRRRVRLPWRIGLFTLAPNDAGGGLDGGGVLGLVQGRHHLDHRRRSSHLRSERAEMQL